MPNPADGSVWGSVIVFPARWCGLIHGRCSARSTTCPCRDLVCAVPTSIATASSGPPSAAAISRSFDRRKCKGPLNGPTATGNHCPEGWTLYRLPGPGFAQLPQLSVESSYYTWVDQHDTLGLGANVPIATGNLFDGIHALVNGKFVTLRVPYPLGFYMKGMEGRIDDANAGWKGRGIWVTEGDRTPAHKEGGGKPLIVHFQMRPDPLAD